MSEPINWKRVAKRIRVPMGFVMAGVYLWLARPCLISVGASLPLVAAGLWLRGYAAGYVRKNSELTITGPYAYTRNPLYLGSMFIAFGFGVAAGSWLLLGTLAVVFTAIYLPVIKGEEEYLRGRFTAFDGYSRSVPRLLPRLRPHASNSGKGVFSRALYLHHREYNALMGSIAIYWALLLRLWYTHHFSFIGPAGPS